MNNVFKETSGPSDANYIMCPEDVLGQIGGWSKANKDQKRKDLKQRQN